MSLTPEEKVLRYLEKHSKEPLVFSKASSNPYMLDLPPVHWPLVPPHDLCDAREMVWFIMRESLHRSSSYKKGGRKQCRIYARRSSLDIWRHVIEFSPELSLFDIMRALYISEYQRQFCTRVKKRVFRYSETSDFLTLRDNYPDEYGLVFSEWKNIGI